MLQPSVPASSTSTKAPAMWPDLVCIVLGLISALVAGALLAQINLTFHLALFAFSYWVIFPVGALLCGFAAGSGYIAAARLLKRRAGGLVHVAAVVTSALGYAFIYYVEYRSISSRGVQLSSVMSFPEFIDSVVRQSQIRWQFSATTGPMGVAGYGLTTLHLLGFVFGGFGASMMAAAHKACDQCRRFVIPRVATAYGEPGVGNFHYVRFLAEHGWGAHALAHVDALGGPDSNVRLRIEVATCEVCRREQYAITVATLNNVGVGYVPLGQRSPSPYQWKPVSGGTTAGTVDITTAPAPTPTAPLGTPRV